MNNIINAFKAFITANYGDKIAKAIRNNDSFFIDFKELDLQDQRLADELLNNPKEILSAFKTAYGELEFDLTPRFINLPENSIVKIKNIRTKNLNKLIQIDGIVRQASEVRPASASIIFECPACAQKIEEVQESTRIKEPKRCPNCGRMGKFTVSDQVLDDTQRIIIEESPEKMDGGEQPQRMSIILKNDLVDPTIVKKTCPGSKVEVTGILQEVPIYLRSGGKSNKFDLIIQANAINPIEYEFTDIEISKEDEKAIKEFAKDPKVFDKFVDSIAPNIYGNREVKGAIAIQLFGGARKVRRDGTAVRGDIHILLIGDPGVSKTQLLRYIAKIAPKARYVSGKSSSAAGLCVTPDTIVVMPNGGFKTIKEVVDEYITVDGELISKKADFKIMGFNDKTLKVEPMNVSKVWKIKSPEKLVRITTRTGREVKITLNNPVPIIEKGKVKWIKAKDLNKNHRLATPRILRTNGLKEIDTIDKIDSSAHLINSSSMIKRIIEKIHKNNLTIREFAKQARVNENNLYHNWRKELAKGNPKISELLKMYKILGIKPNGCVPEKMRLSQYNGHEIQFPNKLNNNLMYFAGLISGDGDIQSTPFGGLTTRFHNQNEGLLQDFKKLSNNLFSINPKIKGDGIERAKWIRINSKIISQFLNKLGIPSGKKSSRIDIPYELSSLSNEFQAQYLRGLFDSDGSIIVRKTGSSNIEFTTISKLLARKLQITLLKYGIISYSRKRPPKEGIIRGRKIKSKEKYVLTIYGKENLLKFEKNIGFNHQDKKEKLRKAISNIKGSAFNLDNIPCESLGLNTPHKTISRRRLQQLAKFHDLAYSDILWDEIKSIEVIDKEDNYVYDLTIEDTHSFVANGLIVHNTASVIKDEYVKGWSLEAGALVLANRGIALIDELDKMTAEDRSALHEGLESQTITISKANIQATLNSQTSVLAAANPKFGRFDPFIPIAEQIDIPPTLLNRFDLIFPMRDLPDKDRDSRIAGHMLESAQEPDKKRTVIDSDFLRKYIAYAKKINPKLSNSAANVLKEFYVGLRNKKSMAEDEVRAIPISPRQLEALIRLSEGCARLRLSDKVSRKDAQQAINLLKFCLSKVGMDPETGEIDIDRIVSGITAKQRGNIMLIKEIINELSNKFGEAIPTDEVIQEAIARGMDEQKAEEMINKMKREGEIFEPKHGVIRKLPR